MFEPKPKPLIQRSWWAGLLALLIVSGCATHRDRLAIATPIATVPNSQDHEAVQRARKSINEVFPAQYRAVQRAIISLGHRQFTCDGVLEVSPKEGCRLALISQFGLVAEVRVNADGAGKVLKVTPLFREQWSEQYVIRDLKWLFTHPSDPLESAGRLMNGQLVLQAPLMKNGVTARYLFSPAGDQWQGLELFRGLCCFYRVSVKHYRAFQSTAASMPSEYEVDAGVYKLHLRIAELTALSSGPPATKEVKP